jgi:hypothetical protein
MPPTDITTIFAPLIQAAPWCAVLVFMWWQERQARLLAEGRYQKLAEIYDALLRELAFGSKIEAQSPFK